MSRPAGVMRGALWGAAAGAAGTTALNALTYLDMAARGRPASDTPSATLKKLEGATPLEIPGDGETHDNRVAGLGSLNGVVVGVATGMLLGAARGAGWRPSEIGTVSLSTLGALLAGNAPMTALGVSDPRKWSISDWISDLIPHTAYGIVCGLILADRT